MKYQNTITRALIACLLLVFCGWVGSQPIHYPEIRGVVFDALSTCSLFVALGLFYNLQYWWKIDFYTNKIEDHKGDLSCFVQRGYVWQELNRPANTLRDLCHAMNLLEPDKEIDAACGQLLLLKKYELASALMELQRPLNQHRESDEEYIQALRQRAIKYCTDKSERRARLRADFPSINSPEQ